MGLVEKIVGKAIKEAHFDNGEVWYRGFRDLLNRWKEDLDSSGEMNLFVTVLKHETGVTDPNVILDLFKRAERQGLVSPNQVKLVASGLRVSTESVRSCSDALAIKGMSSAMGRAFGSLVESPTQAPQPGAYFEFRNKAEEDLWKEELIGQISDGAYENWHGTHWEYWCDIPTRVGTKTRVVKGTYSNYFPFAQDLLQDLGDRMLEIVHKTMPSATKEDLRKMLVHIQQACRFPIKESVSDDDIWGPEPEFDDKGHETPELMGRRVKWEKENPDKMKKQAKYAPKGSPSESVDSSVLGKMINKKLPSLGEKWNTSEVQGSGRAYWFDSDEEANVFAEENRKKGHLVKQREDYRKYVWVSFSKKNHSEKSKGVVGGIDPTSESTDNFGDIAKKSYQALLSSFENALAKAREELRGVVSDKSHWAMLKRKGINARIADIEKSISKIKNKLKESVIESYTYDQIVAAEGGERTSMISQNLEDLVESLNESDMSLDPSVKKPEAWLIILNGKEIEVVYFEKGLNRMQVTDKVRKWYGTGEEGLLPDDKLEIMRMEKDDLKESLLEDEDPLEEEESEEDNPVEEPEEDEVVPPEEEAEEEPISGDDETKPALPEKEYLGLKGDVNFYLVRKMSDAGEVQDLIIVDQEDKPLMSAKKKGFDLDDPLPFFSEAARELDIEKVDFGFFERYFWPVYEEMLKKQEEEEAELGEEPEQAQSIPVEEPKPGEFGDPQYFGRPTESVIRENARHEHFINLHLKGKPSLAIDDVVLEEVENGSRVRVKAGQKGLRGYDREGSEGEVRQIHGNGDVDVYFENEKMDTFKVNQLEGLGKGDVKEAASAPTGPEDIFKEAGIGAGMWFGPDDDKYYFRAPNDEVARTVAAKIGGNLKPSVPVNGKIYYVVDLKNYVPPTAAPVATPEVEESVSDSERFLYELVRSVVAEQGLTESALTMTADSLLGLISHSDDFEKEYKELAKTLIKDWKAGKYTHEMAKKLLAKVVVSAADYAHEFHKKLADGEIVQAKRTTDSEIEKAEDLLAKKLEKEFSIHEGYQIMGAGIKNKQDADDLARKKPGSVVEKDPENPEEFIVISKEEKE